MQKKYKICLFVIVIILVLLIGFSVYMRFFRKSNKETTNTSSIINTIDEYGYNLDDRDTELMKNEFQNLEVILKEEEIDYLEYAKSISKLFVIDLYTINNKINKYDIGSLEFILDSEQEKFKNIILDSIYESVLDNSYHKRNQKLPEVKSTEINEVAEQDYIKGKEKINSYVVDVSWEYVEDLGYDNRALITIINESEKLFVVEYNPVIEEGETE